MYPPLRTFKRPFSHNRTFPVYSTLATAVGSSLATPSACGLVGELCVSGFRCYGSLVSDLVCGIWLRGPQEGPARFREEGRLRTVEVQFAPSSHARARVGVGLMEPSLGTQCQTIQQVSVASTAVCIHGRCRSGIRRREISVCVWLRVSDTFTVCSPSVPRIEWV